MSPAPPLFRSRLRALSTGAVGLLASTVLAASLAVATSAAATSANASCSGISFTVLHNDTSGGVTLPQGKYTVSSPNLGCKTASNYFTTFLEQIQPRDPGLDGQADRQGLGHLHQEPQQHAVHREVEQREERSPPAGCSTSALKVSLGSANGTAGTTFYPLKFVNKSNPAALCAAIRGSRR